MPRRREGLVGNKLTVAFDKAGEKRVVDRFVNRVRGPRTNAEWKL